MEAKEEMSLKILSCIELPTRGKIKIECSYSSSFWVLSSSKNSIGSKMGVNDPKSFYQDAKLTEKCDPPKFFLIAELYMYIYLWNQTLSGRQLTFCCLQIIWLTFSPVNTKQIHQLRFICHSSNRFNLYLYYLCSAV